MKMNPDRKLLLCGIISTIVYSFLVYFVSDSVTGTADVVSSVFAALLMGFITMYFYARFVTGPEAKRMLDALNAQVQQAVKCAEMDSRNKLNDTLILKKRDNTLKTILHIEQAINASTTYHPEKYIGTAATSGGITVGSVSKIDAHYTLDTSGSGKYKLIYNVVLNGKEVNYNVEKITIENPKDLEAARRNTTIAKLIKGNQIILFSDTNDFLERQMFASVTGPYDPKMQQICELKNMRRLSKQDCSAVLDWLAGGL